jgi:ribosomal-protein-alanine N-acetyltransferase
LGSSNIIIRKAVPQDIPSCLEAEASHGDNTFSEGDLRNSITEPNAIFLVAEQRGQVVGFILGYVVPTRKREAAIHSTMVNSRYEKKGIGSSLVLNFARLAFGKGVELVYAEVETGPDKFYEKCGFRKSAVWYSMLLKDIDGAAP